MEYRIYKLSFANGVRFGKKSLEDGEFSFHADTLFSALCQEALGQGGEEKLNGFLQRAHAGTVQLSDAFPFIGERYYIPKPFLRIEPKEDQGDSNRKKLFKRMKYLPLELLKEYLSGDFPQEHMEDLDGLGHAAVKTSVALRGKEEAEPYRVECYYYEEGNGIYFIAGYGGAEDQAFLEGLLEGLSYAGIGGKRFAGLGRFQWSSGEVPALLLNRLDAGAGLGMLLSVALPKEEELERALGEASYQVIKRSGFVSSTSYAQEYIRKRDLYVFNAGSCFTERFEGDIYDVSSGGSHPVYRYAKPMFMGVGR